MRRALPFLSLAASVHQGVVVCAFSGKSSPSSPLQRTHDGMSRRGPNQFTERTAATPLLWGSLHPERRSKSTRRYLSTDNDLPAEQKQRSDVARKTNSTGNGIQADGVSGSVAISPLDASQDYLVAMKRTAIWVAAAVVFGIGLSHFDNPTTAEEFFAGYLLEQSLSIDNLLVFLLLFDYFKIPQAYQNRILNWGIFGAIVMRAIMIGAGAVAIQQFHAVLLVFAAVLIYSSAKVLIGGNDDDEEDEDDFSQNIVVQFSKRFIQSTNQFDGDRFFTEVDGIRLATPMFLCMVAVELSDVIFAVDSIPAVFGVTENPLVVFTSNMFAIMGLRSLYTVLSKAASELEYLEAAVAVVLGFIGSKMVAEFFGYPVPTEISLAVVATLLGGGVVVSLLTKGDEILAEMEADETTSPR